jgi:hypothetical protein
MKKNSDSNVYTKVIVHRESGCIVHLVAHPDPAVAAKIVKSLTTKTDKKSK